MVKYYCPQCNTEVVELEVEDYSSVNNIYYNSLSNIIAGNNEPVEWKIRQVDYWNDGGYNFGKYRTVCCGCELSKDIYESTDMLIRK